MDLNKFYKQQEEELNKVENELKNDAQKGVKIPERLFNFLKAENLKIAFEQALSKIQFPDVQKVSFDWPDVQKVEVTNPAKQPIVNVVEKTVEFPKKQEVYGLVKVEQFDRLEELLDGVLKAIKAQPAPEKLPSVQDVKITNWQHVASQGGGEAKLSTTKVWLREEYTFETIAGAKKPTKIEKWDDMRKLTEVIEYDDDGNPTTKSRTYEPHDGVGV